MIKRMHLLLPILEVSRTVPGTLDPLPEIAREIIFPFQFRLGINFLKPTRCLRFNLNFWRAGRAGWGAGQPLGALQWGFCAFLCPRHGSILSRESPADKKQKVERCSSTHDFDPTGKVLKFQKKNQTKALGSRIKNYFNVVFWAVLFCEGDVGTEMDVGLILNHPHNQPGLVYQ